MLKYRGGKSRELVEILPFVPKRYDRYIEPFFGGGALYFHLEPERAVVNDLNEPLISFYRGVRDDYDVVHGEIASVAKEYNSNRVTYDAEKMSHPEERIHDPNEDLYYRIRDMFNGRAPSTYTKATLYFIINKTAYSGMVRYNANGEFNVPYGRYKRLNADQVTRDHSELLRRASITSGDYGTVFDECKKDDFVFLDPPYDCVFSDYGNEETKDGFGEDEHRRLSSAFFELPCKALLVIGKTDFTYSLYKDAIVHEYDKSYAVNIRNRFKSTSKHILVANY